MIQYKSNLAFDKCWNQPMNEFRKVEWVLKFSGWPGTTMSGEIGYPPKPQTFGLPEHNPVENKPLDRGPRRAARLVSPRSLPMRLLLQSAQFLLRRYREGFCLLFWIQFSTWVSDGGESCWDLVCYEKKIRKILTFFWSDFLYCIEDCWTEIGLEKSSTTLCA